MKRAASFASSTRACTHSADGAVCPSLATHLQKSSAASSAPSFRRCTNASVSASPSGRNFSRNVSAESPSICSRVHAPSIGCVAATPRLRIGRSHRLSRPHHWSGREAEALAPAHTFPPTSHSTPHLPPSAATAPIPRLNSAVWAALLALPALPTYPSSPSPTQPCPVGYVCEAVLAAVPPGLTASLPSSARPSRAPLAPLPWLSHTRVVLTPPTLDPYRSPIVLPLPALQPLLPLPPP